MSELSHPSVDEDAACIRLVLLVAHTSKPGTPILGASRWPVLIDLAAVTAFMEVLAARLGRLADFLDGRPSTTGGACATLAQAEVAKHGFLARRNSVAQDALAIFWNGCKRAPPSPSSLGARTPRLLTGLGGSDEAPPR